MPKQSAAGWESCVPTTDYETRAWAIEMSCRSESGAGYRLLKYEW